MDNLKKTEEAIKNGQSRENRRGNQEWTIQRNFQHWVHKTQDEDKQDKDTTQKTKTMSKTDQNQRLIQAPANGKQYLPLI